jgi:hypothetical protein
MLGLPTMNSTRKNPTNTNEAKMASICKDICKLYRILHDGDISSVKRYELRDKLDKLLKEKKKCEAKRYYQNYSAYYYRINYAHKKMIEELTHLCETYGA